MEPLTFDTALIWPVLAIVALTFASGFYLVSLRFRALRNGAMRLSFYRSYRTGEEPEKIAVATRHYINLFETPVLFYVGCIVAALIGPTASLALSAAWLFVVLRVLQSGIHLTTNNVKWRAYSFFMSWFALLTLWVSNALALWSYPS